ncbi:hypothetical protein K2224_38075 (plasmid) [Streptomyces sp. BHT-5-2]|uniref:hypothetical protein n=1 Tax=Streptomyces sp. BHT-5-2 TaxID=2866715 RepID=UPI001C8D97A1|nr:hypothetical protein [Streptomyces sp. BHT-5-2]QZL08834.1 hypothetical protein K2224_38075 [Streptomyces sp. BHT-5-2]
MVPPPSLRRWALGLAVAGALVLSAAPGAAAASGPHLSYTGGAPGVRVEVNGPVEFEVAGMPAGTDEVTVTSPALIEPVPLTPLGKGSVQFVQTGAPGTRHRIRGDIAPGTYPVTATSHGRIVATARMAVVAEGPAVIGRFVVGDAKRPLPGDGERSAVRPGSDVIVVLTDRQPAAGETSLTVKSPLFDGPLTLREGEDDPGCKCDDGSRLFGGHTAVRDDIPAGRYLMTVVSHHGQETTTRQVTVAGPPVPHSRPPWLIGGGVALSLVALASLAVRRQRRKP